jgi:hypothetical protein
MISEGKMSASAAKIAASRENGRKAKGRPRDTSKSRYNATTHALTSRGLTEFDDKAEHERTLRELQQQEAAEGVYQNFLVNHVAFAMLRCNRARRFEAENFEQVLHPTKYERKSPLEDLQEVAQGKVVDAGPEATVKAGTVQNLSALHRYETMYFNSATKAMRELKFHQQIRREECSRSSDSENVVRQQSNLTDARSYDESNVSPNCNDGSSTAAREVIDANSATESSSVTENQLSTNEPSMVDVTAPRGPSSDRLTADTAGGEQAAQSWFPYRKDGPAWQK